jgi:hypothetical protein
MCGNNSDHIEEAITLERKAMKALLLKHLCNTIGALGTCHTIYAAQFDESRAPHLLYATLEAHHEVLLQHTDLSLLDVFAGLHEHMWPEIATYNPDIAEVHQETVIDCVNPFFKTLEGASL